MSRRDIKDMAGTPSRQDMMMIDLISACSGADYEEVYKRYFELSPKESTQSDADFLRENYG